VAIENVKLYQKTKETSVFDDVSSLFNLRYFHQALERELKLTARHKSRLTLLFIDLDAFKEINDAHGHLRGTKVLREIGFLLRAAIRETDIAARYGGDEFIVIVILPDTDSPQNKRLGERMRQLILRTTFLKEESINARLEASIGIATFPPSRPPRTSSSIWLTNECTPTRKPIKANPFPSTRNESRAHRSVFCLSPKGGKRVLQMQ
jgi:diguanylate cyclase (GGDEF)-like protein